MHAHTLLQQLTRATPGVFPKVDVQRARVAILAAHEVAKALRVRRARAGARRARVLIAATLGLVRGTVARGIGTRICSSSTPMHKRHAERVH